MTLAVCLGERGARADGIIDDQPLHHLQCDLFSAGVELLFRREHYPLLPDHLGSV